MHAAHKIARNGVEEFGGSYSVALSAALKYVYSVVSLRVKIQNKSNLGFARFDFLKATFQIGSLEIENNRRFNVVETESDIQTAFKKLSSHVVLNC